MVAGFAEEALRRAWVTPVDERAPNRSPFGVVGMAGNGWEWTSTSLGDVGEAVICGGSYDNPLRAVQASSKGIYRKRGCSNAVGFRCVQDITGTLGTERQPMSGGRATAPSSTACQRRRTQRHRRLLHRPGRRGRPLLHLRLPADRHRRLPYHPHWRTGTLPHLRRASAGQSS